MSASSDGPAHTHQTAIRAMPGDGLVSRHLLVALVRNKPGVLNRVASLLRARDFNIESLSVNHTDRPELSRMTIAIVGDEMAVEQAAKQLYRLIDVLKVRDVSAEPVIDHEIALIKIRANTTRRAEVLAVLEGHRVLIADLTDRSLVVEATGTEAQIDDLITLLRGFGIAELARSGAVVMSRGPGSVEEEVKWRAAQDAGDHDQ
jgi:acetolactate synthase-1/3 small subunit